MTTDEERNKALVRRNFWKKAKATVGKIPFVKDAVTLYYCANDSRTPLTARVIAYAALAYFVLPLDVIPDAIPALGFTDDLAAIVAAVKSLNPHIRDDHRQKAADWLATNPSEE